MGLDGEHLAAAYRREARPMLRFFTRRTWDAQAASDLVGETFAAALAGRGSYRGGDSDDELAAWLHGIARNQLAYYFKRGAIERRAMERIGIERAALGDAEIERIEELAGLAVLRQQVADSVEGLPETYRDAVKLRVVDEFAYDDVAARLGISEQAARARVSRGLRSLSEALVVTAE